MNLFWKNFSYSTVDSRFEKKMDAVQLSSGNNEQGISVSEQFDKAYLEEMVNSAEFKQKKSFIKRKSTKIRMKIK